MAVLIYVGKPRSGKSYRVVSDLLSAKNQERFFYLHNIDGLKPEAFKYPDRVVDFRNLVVDQDWEQFFSIENQRAICEEVRDKYGLNDDGSPRVNVLVVVDEAHQYGFDRNNKVIRSWMAYHGHFGQEIWLVAQREVLINASYRAFSEFCVIALNNAMLNWLPGFFLYAIESSGGVKCGTKWVRKRQEVFAAYKSFEMGGVRKHSSYKLPAVAALSVLGLGFFFYHAPSIFDDKSKKPAEAQAAVVEKKADGRRDRGESNVKVESPKVGVVGDAYRLASQLDGHIYVQNCSDGRIVPLEVALGKGQVLKNTGRTVLYASHELGQVFHLSSAPVRLPAASEEKKE